MGIQLNEDGVSVKGCNYIYAPKGQAGEYAPLAVNPYRGCGHACVYCYCPLVLKMDRKAFDSAAIPRPNFLANLRKDAKKYQAAGVDAQAMLSFTSDAFNPYDTSLTRPSIEILKDHGLAFCTLTKGGSRALPYIDMFRPDRDAFASTMTSLDDAFSRKWERGAALPSDRLATLKAFHERGVFCWLSLEPTISAEASLPIVDATYEFVDYYKVGKANYIKTPESVNWQDYTLRMIEKLQKLGKRHYIKRDLQGFLPEGYVNPLRIEQHH